MKEIDSSASLEAVAELLNDKIDDLDLDPKVKSDGFGQLFFQKFIINLIILIILILKLILKILFKI